MQFVLRIEHLLVYLKVAEVFIVCLISSLLLKQKLFSPTKTAVRN